MHPLRRFCDARLDWAVATLEDLVRFESPTDDKAAVDRCGRRLRDLAEALGARVDVLPQATAGDHLRATFGSGPLRVLLLGHMDTVWPVGQLERMPLARRDGRLYGPGVYDMKAGLVIGLLAMRALFESATAPAVELVYLLTSDEETGSRTSRPLIEAEARQAAAVLVLEPALAGGAVKTARKGVGEYALHAYGVPAHAGGEPGRGASAIVEMAHQVLALQRLQDPARGITINAGVIDGGTRSNVVAEHATAYVDVRIAHAEDEGRVDAALRALAPVTPRTRLEVRGRINRPPMERTAGVASLYRLAHACGRDLGLAIEEGSTGGASDGNFTAALGVPTLDGLGAVGDGAHARDEHVRLDAIPERAALLAALIARLAGGTLPE